MTSALKYSRMILLFSVYGIGVLGVKMILARGPLFQFVESLLVRRKLDLLFDLENQTDCFRSR